MPIILTSSCSSLKLGEEVYRTGGRSLSLFNFPRWVLFDGNLDYQKLENKMDNFEWGIYGLLFINHNLWLFRVELPMWVGIQTHQHIRIHHIEVPNFFVLLIGSRVDRSLL